MLSGRTQDKIKGDDGIGTLASDRGLREVINVLTILTNLIAVILQYIHISNDHVAHLKLTQCYLSIISQQIWGQRKDTEAYVHCKPF